MSYYRDPELQLGKNDRIYFIRADLTHIPQPGTTRLFDIRIPKMKTEYNIGLFN